VVEVTSTNYPSVPSTCDQTSNSKLDSFLVLLSRIKIASWFTMEVTSNSTSFDYMKSTKFDFSFPPGARIVDMVPEDMKAYIHPHWNAFPPVNPMWHYILGIGFIFLGITAFLGKTLLHKLTLKWLNSTWSLYCQEMVRCCICSPLRKIWKRRLIISWWTWLCRIS